MSKIRVKLVRSRIQADKRQAAVLDGLNLKKLNAESELEDTPAVRGMVAKVQHLVKVL
ncbi:MAG: 50S ribosomal protein L30 [Deltaproteobacteria bacterium]|nr:MAG: 50S ribosomal protein L30 [Deltaproteobacteria bacterium]